MPARLEKREARREAKAEVAARLDKSIEQELLARLQVRGKTTPANPAGPRSPCTACYWEQLFLRTRASTPGHDQATPPPQQIV